MPITADPNVPLDNKQLRIYGERGKYTRVSVDEAIARGLNEWKGWKCSAGVRNLYIDYDGNIWNGNCASSNRNSGAHHNQVVEEWRMERDRIFGPYPHEDWYNTHTDGGWPLPKRGWEDSEQHLKLQAELTQAEAAFFENLGSNMTRDLDINASAWKWESTIADTKDHWGLLGNIREGFDMPEEWIECPFKSCGCGADVILSKAKTAQARRLLAVTNQGYIGQHNTNSNYVDAVEEQTGVEMNFPIPYQILWDIGRRCNYNCSYCWPAVHSNTEKFPDFDVVIRAIDMVIDNWSNGEPIRWNFGGGEPTMHPKFMEILKHLRDRHQWVLVTTNGSRSTKFWREAVEYINTVNFSAHFASMDKYRGNEDRFIENAKIVMAHHDIVDDDFWIEIKLMVEPGMLDRAIEFKDRILALGMLDKVGANGRMKGVMSLVPLRDINDASQLVDYSDNEINFFQDQ